MPIYLPAPSHNPSGVDGKGWNRIAIHGMCNDECALKPKTLTAFLDSLDTRKVKYGMYGQCFNNGDCDTCRVYFEEREWKFFSDSILIRVDNNGTPWLMNKTEKGWEEFGIPTSWAEILKIKGANFKRHKDEFSDGVMMTRITV